MTFGLLKHFKDTKSGNTQTIPTKHFQHVILGQDLGAVLKLLEIRKNHPEASVRLVTSRPLNKKLLVENYEFGVSQLRSSSAVELIYRKFHDAKLLPQSKDANFYKEGKFHDFGGRAKPMDLQNGEEFFTHKGYKVNLESLFTAEDWQNLDTILNQCSEIRIFDSIDKTTPDDLVQKNEWLLTFKDFNKITAEFLYVSLSPKKFLGYIHDKSKLTKDFVDVCTSANVQGAISVTWKLDKELYAEEKTLFIPQSMTHEWGHFIVEFDAYNYQNKEQLCHVLFLIHEEEPQSEDLAQKIKLMKRVLDRVFPDFEKHIKQEYIRFDEEMFISEVKDSSIEQLNFDYPTLRFLGQMSPMQAELSNEKYLSRVLLN